MKKITLLILFLSSFAFSETISYFKMNGINYKVLDGHFTQYSSVWFMDIHQIDGNIYSYNTGAGLIYVFEFEHTGSGDLDYYAKGYHLDLYTSIPSCSQGQILDLHLGCTALCTDSQDLINGVCVDKCPSSQDWFNGQCVAKCDQTASQFRQADGTCQDCIIYSSFSGRASCACDSQGSTYTSQKTISIGVSIGKYTYQRTNITCGDGTRISIYHDPVNTSPNDYNKTYDNGTVTPVDSNNTTTEPETNTTTPTQTVNDVVDALKVSSDVSKDIKTEVGKVATDMKALNESVKAHGMTFNEILAQIKADGAENQKSNQLLGDVNTGLTQFKNKFGQWVDQDQLNSNAQVSATHGVKGAVDSASNAITTKLDEVIDAIKDTNGTSIDLNTTNAKLDTLHDDNNKTQSILDKIAGFFETNSSIPDVNTTGQEFVLTDLLPDNSFFETNKLRLSLNNYHGACYLETTTFNISGHSFEFPPPSLIAMIPFNIISNLMMGLLFILGLRDFLRS